MYLPGYKEIQHTVNIHIIGNDGLRSAVHKLFLNEMPRPMGSSSQNAVQHHILLESTVAMEKDHFPFHTAKDHFHIKVHNTYRSWFFRRERVSVIAADHDVHRSYTERADHQRSH